MYRIPRGELRAVLLLTLLPRTSAQARFDVTLGELSVVGDPGGGVRDAFVDGYTPLRTSTALKIPAPIQDVPVSVQTVPRELIQDRGAI